MLDKNNFGTPIKKVSLGERLNEAYNSQVGVEEYRMPRNHIDLSLQARALIKKSKKRPRKESSLGQIRLSTPARRKKPISKQFSKGMCTRGISAVQTKNKCNWPTSTVCLASRKAEPEIKNQQQTVPSPLKNKTPGKIKVVNLKKR